MTIEIYKGFLWIHGNYGYLEELLASEEIVGPVETITVKKKDIILRGTAIERANNEALKIAMQKKYPIIIYDEEKWHAVEGVGQYRFRFYDVVI
ncbi:MAG: hypothetical protein Q8R37_04285 [Nanoarchaeota archaeon]|nr:hypothetical protein [Nanoarchaeota archaeon]